jgi:glycosyltransferase involved in cell wall biosynthesis
MAERPLTIAWLGHHSRRRGDGVITYSREITEGLRRRGHRVLFFYHDEDRLARDPAALATPDHVPLRALAKNRVYVISSPRSRRVITDMLREERVDVLHVSLAFSSVDFALPDICHELGIPIVGTLHIPYDTRFGVWSGISSVFYRVYSTSLARYDRVVIFSPQQTEMLANFGVPRQIVSVVPNGVDTDRYAPGASDLRESLGAATVLTYLGRIDAEKNVDYLVRAFVEESLPEDVHLMVVGSGSERARLSRRFKNRRIHFPGLVTHEEERLRILRGSDAFFLPSSVEGLSLAMLEAMSCGVCTVATDVGSDGEALRGAGLVLDVRDAESQLRLALRTVVDYPEFRRELGRRCRTRVEERYSLRGNLDALERIYGEIARSAV